jgi:hypothetical protein
MKTSSTMKIAGLLSLAAILFCGCGQQANNTESGTGMSSNTSGNMKMVAGETNAASTNAAAPVNK